MSKTKYVANLAPFAIVLLLSACAGKPQAPPGTEPVQRNLITAYQLSEIDAIDAYTAVQQLRPRWLRPRGSTSLREPLGTLPVVYADNVRMGDVGVLRAVPIAEISEIRFISGPDATTRWGTGVAGGVIEIIRKRKTTKG